MDSPKLPRKKKSLGIGIAMKSSRASESLLASGHSPKASTKQLFGKNNSFAKTGSDKGFGVYAHGVVFQAGSIVES